MAEQAKNHERIWLQPLCCVDERCWCEHPQDCDDPGCDLPAIEYVRADLVAGHADMLAALKECANYIISPLRMTGDVDEAKRRAAIFERARAAIAKATGEGKP